MKFRAWSNQLRKFLPKDECYLNSDGELYFEDVMDGGLLKSDKNSYTIQRSSELYDIYGKLIYEGDVVKLHFTHENIQSESYIVNYNFGKWLLDDCKELNRYWVDCKSWGDTCKVVIVGNIFE